MTAYLIGIRNWTINPEEMAIYAQKGAGTLPPTASPLAVYAPHEVLEGDPIEGVLIVQFHDMDAARKWYNSEAYEEARKHRLKGADYKMILTEGL